MPRIAFLCEEGDRLLKKQHELGRFLGQRVDVGPALEPLGGGEGELCGFRARQRHQPVLKADP